MYPKEKREFALDLWFAMRGEMSLESFCEELGWPNRETMRPWVRADPRDDPDKPRFDSRPVPTRLEAIRRVSEGAPLAAAVSANVKPADFAQFDLTKHK